jgi:DNA helicase-2/ATP-dependent DNA helicase PcrA
MAKRQVQKPSLLVAGPGAGKTYGMAGRIARELPALEVNRFLAGITFTNAACDNIREHVHRLTRPGANVFIGTIHAFANRFILAPFAHLTGHLGNERIFGGIDVNQSIDEMEKTRQRQFTPQERNYWRARITRSLLAQGVVTHDEIIRLSLELLKENTVSERVCSRLQFLFIDELQDTDTRHWQLFECLLNGGRTSIDAVGDPEQYIYTFTYRMRGVRAPAFDRIPFFRFQEQARQNENLDNRRACKEIVEFTNHFHAQLKQQSTVGSRGAPRVLFIPGTDLNITVRKFRELYEQIPHDNRRRGRYQRFYLGYEKATFDAVSVEFGIRRLAKETHPSRTLLKSALALLALCCGASQQQVCKELGLDEHNWRKCGFHLLCQLRDNHIQDLDGFCEFWAPRLNISTLGAQRTAVADAFGELRDAFLTCKHAQWNDWSSSIHQAKGLEADAVLAVARSLNELIAWCETDHARRKADKADRCRLGFVAFSRAMELLCVSCLKPLDNKTRSHLQCLGVTLLPSA